MKKKGDKTGIAPGYLHGYSATEQERLYRQARFLESSIYRDVDFSKQTKLIEVGCGVGAQTEILLERFSNLSIDGIDSQAVQIEEAKRRLQEQISAGRAHFHVGDALHLPFPEKAFDGAFVCWFLEHVQEPVEILRELKRVLTPDALIYCSEVLNSSLFLHPYSPATLQYWFIFNDYQWSLHGDPFVGAKLANYLLAAGFHDVTTTARAEHFDNRTPERRAKFIEYWTSLLLSGAPSLIQAGKITPERVDEMTLELGRLKDDPDAVFFYTWIQANARA